ncbi:MAG: bifunctional adenosylcobinamide kinase/adenosylcobinamide-phosphate guanylyltransferase [Clostridia bacterium]|nr:bifunctional adenosylcobinamide kinase/adenosylcobinamide-phosphate guanylyltransferase [Clostridia bacterium]
MILVFGGMYQGKTDFARGLGKDPEPVPDLTAEIEQAMARGDDPDEYIEKRLPELRDRVVLVNDYSQGLVPMSPGQRAFREACGRAMIRLARESSEVYRVFCGIGTRIK